MIQRSYIWCCFFLLVIVANAIVISHPQIIIRVPGKTWMLYVKINASKANSETDIAIADIIAVFSSNFLRVWIDKSPAKNRSPNPKSIEAICPLFVYKIGMIGSSISIGSSCPLRVFAA